MPAYYSYQQTILATQTTVDGGTANYNFAPPSGATWSYSGSMFSHLVYEEDPGATFYNGDPTNETVQATMDIGQSGEQSTSIDGSQVAVVYDYTFTVSDGTNTYQVAVIDADLDGDGVMDSAGEDGYYLVFLGTPPPPDTPLTIGSIVDNSDNILHSSLGAIVVCFTKGTMIMTALGPVAVENLCPGMGISTADNGVQPLLWVGHSKTEASDAAAPIRILANALGNHRDLLVSPQHRMVISGATVEMLFAEHQVFVAAKHLVDGINIVREPAPEIDYFHLLFADHQIVFAEGAPAESFYPAQYSLSAMDNSAQQAIADVLARNNRSVKNYGPAARTTLKAREADLLHPPVAAAKLLATKLRPAA